MTASYGVVVPAHNAERTLGEAIESLLAQTRAPARIVVVDDGSEDGTAEIARAFGAFVELIRQPHRGPAVATDRGLARIRESLIAGLDADDVWFPRKAEAQIAELGREPRLDGIFCHASVFAHGMPPDPAGRSHPLWGRSAMMLRRASMARVGLVSSGGTGYAGEMVDWVARGRELGLRFGLRPDVLVGRRRMPGSLADGQDAAALLPAVIASLDRKRKRSAS